MEGDHRCYYTQGAKHCVLSTFAVWTGAGQVCCYDYEGWLMFSDDFEYNDQYLRFYSAGVPYRAHPWGVHPYKRPPFVPTLSNLYNDLLPYDFCCKWAGESGRREIRATASCRPLRVLLLAPTDVHVPNVPAAHSRFVPRSSPHHPSVQPRSTAAATSTLTTGPATPSTARATTC